jgi:hypothetical protein
MFAVFFLFWIVAICELISTGHWIWASALFSAPIGVVAVAFYQYEPYEEDR